MAASRHTRNHEQIAFDTPGRPKQDDLEALVDGCDLLIIPATLDTLSIDATLETVDLLNSLKCDRYEVRLTIIPPLRKIGEQAREALADL